MPPYEYSYEYRVGERGGRATHRGIFQDMIPEIIYSYSSTVLYSLPDYEYRFRLTLTALANIYRLWALNKLRRSEIQNRHICTCVAAYLCLP